MNCPICEDKMERKQVEFRFGDISFGKFDADVCLKCGENFFTEEASDEIDKKSKELGLWGLSRKTKISYSGNSMIVRIPKNISDFLKLKTGEDVMIHPEGKKRLIIELK